MQDENTESTKYFFQLPARLPLPKQSSTATGKEKVGNSRSSNSTSSSDLDDLKKLSAGCMGKLLIYKSGAIKLRLGDILYDVSKVVNFLQPVSSIVEFFFLLPACSLDVIYCDIICVWNAFNLLCATPNVTYRNQ